MLLPLASSLNPLGRGRVAGLIYLLRDEFTTAAAAPLASPRTCEPGPGSLTLVQNDGQFSISAGKLLVPSQATPVHGDVRVYDNTSRSRLAGRAVFATANFNSVTGKSAYLNWTSSSSGSPTAWEMNLGFYPGGHGRLIATTLNGNYVVDLEAIVAGVDYQLGIVQRGSGGFALIKGGAFTNWTLVWVFSAETLPNLFPQFTAYESAGTLDDFRVLDLPPPWNDDYGIATQRLSGSVPVGTAFTHTANCLIEWTQTTLPTAGTYTDVFFRQQDVNNRWLVEIDSAGNFDLLERIGGSYFGRLSFGGAVGTGHRIVLVVDGTTIRPYINNVAKTPYTSATNFQTATSGLRRAVSVGGGTVTNLVAWPRDPSAYLTALN